MVEFPLNRADHGPNRPKFVLSTALHFRFGQSLRIDFSEPRDSAVYVSSSNSLSLSLLLRSLLTTVLSALEKKTGGFLKEYPVAPNITPTFSSLTILSDHGLCSLVHSHAYIAAFTTLVQSPVVVPAVRYELQYD